MWVMFMLYFSLLCLALALCLKNLQTLILKCIIAKVLAIDRKWDWWKTGCVRLCSHPLEADSNRQGGSLGHESVLSASWLYQINSVLLAPPPGLPLPVCGVAGSRSLDSATLGAVNRRNWWLASPFEEKTLQEDGCPCLDQLSAQADPGCEREEVLKSLPSTWAPSAGRAWRAG